MKIPKAKKLPSGSWTAQVQVDGKRVSVTRPTEKECLAAAAAVKAGAEEKKRPAVLKLSDAYTRYVEMKDGVLSPSTIAGYKRMGRSTFQALMGRDINALTNEQIQREISAMSKAGKSPKYIRNAEGLLSTVLKFYRPDFLLRVTLPQKQPHEQRALTNEELKAILQITKGTDVELPVLMAMWLGMRMSEIIGAKHEDIKDHRLHVQRAIVLDETGKSVVKTTKTTAGNRYIPIPPYIEERMAGEGEYIVPIRRGEVIYKHFVKLLREHNIKPCRFHDLRHANAAVMIQLGIDARYAQERNGWESEYMYKQVYGYTVQSHADKVSRQIDTFFETDILGIKAKNANENANKK